MSAARHCINYSIKSEQKHLKIAKQNSGVSDIPYHTDVK